MSDRTRWALRRAACNLDAKFEALRSVVERDVGDMNGLTEEQRRGYTFSVEREDEGRYPSLTVRRMESGKEESVVSFMCMKNMIAIGGAGKSFEVVPRWNGETTSCDLYVDGERREVWEVSQKALEPLFFG